MSRKSRSYTRDQVAAIVGHQQGKNALATKIALAAGLRAHELLTLRCESERPADPQPSAPEKFHMRWGVNYTVIGKSGFTQRGGSWLCRRVMIPALLSNELESLRSTEPETVEDRGTCYSSIYAVGGGQRWKNSFSQASNAALCRSGGAHGLRHSYAQERMGELQRSGIDHLHALVVVGQELGCSGKSVARMLV